MGLFDELFLMDIDGKVILSTNPAHENEKHSIYDYFIEGLKGPYIQQPSYSLSLGKMTVVTSAPVISNGTLLGVVAGRASLKRPERYHDRARRLRQYRRDLSGWLQPSFIDRSSGYQYAHTGDLYTNHRRRCRPG